VLDCQANPDGTQSIHDTGPLNKKWMETIDDEVLAKTEDFLGRQATSGTPFFVWFNTSHMHLRTHPKPGIRGQAGRWQSAYHDVMVEHDQIVGKLLKKLYDPGIADNTIVMYSTDIGPHMNSWPDAV
jgi:arylsulfatase A-like enzyme